MNPGDNAFAKKVKNVEFSKNAASPIKHGLKTETDSTQDELKYCICDNRDYTTFMICCDWCEIWYHGECAGGVTSKDADQIKKFCCPSCQGKHPGTTTIYKVSYYKNQEKLIKEKKRQTSVSRTDSNKKTDQIPRCRDCIGCFRQDNCGNCEACLSKLGLCYARICVLSGLLDVKPIATVALSEKPKKGRPPKKRIPDSIEITNRDTPTSSRVEKETKFDQNQSINWRLASIYNAYIRGKKIQNGECYGPKCTNSARVGSKYCSDECGLALAEKRLRIILPVRLEMYFRDIPAEQKKDLHKIDQLIEEKANIDGELKRLDTFYENVTQFISAIKTATPLAKTKISGDETFTLGCVICCGEYSIKDITRHMQACFVRAEKQCTFGTKDPMPINPFKMFCDEFNKVNGTYCKRLRVLCFEHYRDEDDIKICGCPLFWCKGDSLSFDNMYISPEQLSTEYCHEKRKHCVSHQNWAQTVLGLIDNERMNLLNQLDAVNEKMPLIQQQKQRRGDVSSLLCNETKHELGEVNENGDKNPFVNNDL